MDNATVLTWFKLDLDKNTRPPVLRLHFAQHLRLAINYASLDGTS